MLKFTPKKVFLTGGAIAGLLIGLLVAQPSARSYFHGVERFKGDPQVNEMMTWSKTVIADEGLQTEFANFVATKTKAGEFTVRGADDYDTVMIRFLLMKITDLNNKIGALQQKE